MRLFWDESNTQPLCHSCHSGHKHRLENQYAGREDQIPDAWEQLLDSLRAQQAEMVLSQG